MRVLLLVNCRLLPKWEYLPSQASCDKYELAAQKAVTARLAWLQKT